MELVINYEMQIDYLNVNIRSLSIQNGTCIH